MRLRYYTTYGGLMTYTVDKSWEEVFENRAFFKNDLNDIMKSVDEKIADGATVYPERENIFAAFNKTPPEKVRVVILGQDPYHEPHQANGLAFSVYNGVAMPPSLRNIFKELQADLGGGLRTDSDLSDWAEQGVLLLNSALTVVEHEANSMAGLWADFTDSVIEAVNGLDTPVVFVLWGNNARKKAKLITNEKHHIIESAHPSPLSASRGFFGSAPFSKVNAFLEQDGFEPINWNG